jgi:predicted  nucleic acid-binding Zn-ribbon protein
VDDEIAELQARLDDRKAELAETKTTREGLVAQVDDEDLVDTYHRLYNKRESQAIVRVTSERSCTSCHVQVTPATYALAQSGAAIAYCDNCSAILFP